MHRLMLVLTALAVAVALAACGAEDAPELAAATDAPLPTDVPAGTKLTIADDANRLATLMRLSGEHDELAADVSYASFSSGPLRLEAIRAGRAQVGLVGDVPPILAQFSDAGVPIVGAIRRLGPGHVLTTSPESGIRRLEDLRGKRVAINEGTAQQAIVLRNLKAVGLTVQDIEPVTLDLAEFVDALRTNQVDAAVVKEPDRSRYLAENERKGARALPNADGANPGLYFLYASRDALADEATAAAVRDFVVHWYRAEKWLNQNRDVWEREYLGKDQNIPPEDARAITVSDGRTAFPGLEELIATQQETVDLLQEAGAFAGKELDAREQFDLRFDGLTGRSQVTSG